MHSESEVACHRGYSLRDVPDVLRISCENKLVGLDSQPVAMFYDMDALKETLLELRAAFPSHFTHAIAIKSNPLPCFLRMAVQMGFGLEAASLMEVMLALRAGCDARVVLFDCPAKSRADIREALAQHVHINANCISELERIDEERRLLERRGVQTRSRVGIRVNPLVGHGTIAALSVSGDGSKFGVALTGAGEAAVVSAFGRFGWLCGVHVHVGSQGCAMRQHADGARRATDLARRVNKEVGEGRIKFIDVGGGLPVNFASAETSPTFSEYAAVLREDVGELFSSTECEVLTEYGRSISAKAGFVACSVEYTREVGPGRGLAVVQAGADLFLRACYAPAAFPLRITPHHPRTGALLQVSSADGAEGGGREEGESVEYEVAGPLCFAGDVLATGQRFPRLREGDTLVVHDAGANTLSLWSRHCSRLAPPVYGYYRPRPGCQSQAPPGQVAEGVGRGGERVGVVLLKGAERPEDLLSFWEPAS